MVQIIPIIVQARMSSTRLPGKVLKPFAGKTFLENCLDRLSRVRSASEVIVATTTGPDCDVLAELAATRGYRVFRGDEGDVLGRYLGAAREAKADAIVRVTSDCPLTDPVITEMVIERYKKGDADLVTTNIPISWPNGMDSEIVSMRALEEAGREGKKEVDREHVTTFVRRRPHRYKLVNLPCPVEGAAYLRMTLDLPADRDFFYRLEREFPDDISTANWQQLLGFLLSRPDITAINENV